MNRITSLVSALALAALSGCATDMRCQCVQDRIKMHEGAPWRMGTVVDDGRDSEHQKLQNKKSLAAFGVVAATDSAKEFSCDKAPKCPGGSIEFSPASIKSFAPAARAAYAIEVAAREQVEEVLPLTGNEDELDREPCRTIEEKEKDDQDLKQGITPVDRSSLPSVEDMRQRYIKGKEIYLSTDQLVVPDALETKLYLVNEGLTCRPRKELDRKGNWRCRDLGSLTPAIPPGKLFGACRKQADGTPTLAVNLFGTLEDRFCLKVSVVEAKEVDKQKARWPSNINNDELIVRISCGSGGPAPPGAVVGGPRPNFRAPGSLESDK